MPESLRVVVGTVSDYIFWFGHILKTLIPYLDTMHRVREDQAQTLELLRAIEQNQREMIRMFEGAIDKHAP